MEYRSSTRTGRIVTRKGSTRSIYITKVAVLGGHRARDGDPLPGKTVMWRGMARLINIALEGVIAPQFVGS